MVGHEVGDVGSEAGRHVHRQCGQGVHRRAEGHDAGQVAGLPVGGGLVGEHAALRIAGQVHVLAGGGFDGVDGRAEPHHVIGQVAVHTALDLIGRTEVDDPRVESGGMQDADGTVVARHIPHVRGHHHRVHHQHWRARRGGTRAGVRREVAPQPVHRHALDDLERRWHGAGLQPAVAKHFQPVLGGSHQPLHRSGDR